MPSGCRKNIMTDYREVIKKMQKIGAENIKGISPERKAMDTLTYKWKPYHTVYYNKRAEFEISPEVLEKLVKLKVIVYADDEEGEDIE